MPEQRVLLGDEAVALGAIHAGVSGCYAYPGTPATEILEAVLQHAARHGEPRASWCANEKTAMEAALGVSMVGRRALVAMKHVGLNVAMDPFVNAAIVEVRGGLVVAVADDPGMHSSQNEQDSRWLADFARVPCLEPATQQEAYAMTREAFALSERLHVPVLVRLVTRLAHSRAVVAVRKPEPELPLDRSGVRKEGWTLLPAFARRQWQQLLAVQPEMQAWAEDHEVNRLRLAGRELGVITTGIARNYYFENLDDLDGDPSHLHVGAWPPPVEKIRRLAAHVSRLVVLEEGYPYLERLLRGLLPAPLPVAGKASGEVPAAGELDPDNVRPALGLPPRQGGPADAPRPMARPPQLCAGCPHADAYAALKTALQHFEQPLVASDIGCYTLGALPPYDAIESCVCMGASVAMARGAAEAGLHPAVAVIGDSTFLHSGVTPLMDAVAAGADMTLVILDNGTVAMTGAQPTVLPSSSLETLILGLGVAPDHLHVVEAHPRARETLAEVLRREMEHRGLSVVLVVRECLESVKKRKREEKRRQGEKA